MRFKRKPSPAPELGGSKKVEKQAATSDKSPTPPPPTKKHKHMTRGASATKSSPAKESVNPPPATEGVKESSVGESSTGEKSKTKLIRGKITEEERMLIHELVEKHGKNWQVVAREFNMAVGRTPKQLGDWWCHTEVPRMKREGKEV
ncbi:hypothetical protein HK097_002795 [Rhizophlyctis rosea]|uniref:Myb-like domain-containing protein n=1 Tax=Rhizophlyctis rosea TaxID=64517 RepID=A0AAD5X0Z5_9FUNG|nr:hypothetical protein HK097_002795 [Rhizophlyctis rosea]